MAATPFLGQILKGRRGLYPLTKQLQDCVWLAMLSLFGILSLSILTIHSNEHQETVIAKSVRHFRLQNERDILLRFQDRTPCIRPLIEELGDSTVPPTLILKHLDNDALRASNKQRLTRLELKYVAKRVLEALSVLHDEGFVHTRMLRLFRFSTLRVLLMGRVIDIKPSNVLVNYGHGDVRFTDVQLADFGSTVHRDSPYAQHGDPIGTPIFRSPEAHLQMRWGTATDIWSFGAMLISLLYGDGFHIFKPDVPPDHDDYDVMILMKHHRCFGPFPESYEQIADSQRLAILVWIMQNSPPEKLRPFHLTSTQEICQEDKEFILRTMKLDPRDRPSARQLLEDEWFRHS